MSTPQTSREQSVDPSLSDWMKELLQVPDAFWVIESLLDRRERNGKVEYYVHWQGFNHNWDTWEPREELLINAMAMVCEYDRIAEPTYDVNAKHCLCKKPYRFEDGAMIQCNGCKKWYHFTCLKLTAKDANSLQYFLCKLCRGNNPSTSQRSRHRDREARRHRLENRPTFYSESSSSNSTGDSLFGSLASPGA